MATKTAPPSRHAPPTHQQPTDTAAPAIRKSWRDDAEWGLSDNNTRAKYYCMTPAGRRHLRQESAWWERFAGAVTAVLGATATHHSHDAT